MQGMATIVLTVEDEGDVVDVQTFFAPRLVEGDNPACHEYAMRMLQAVVPDDEYAMRMLQAVVPDVSGPAVVGGD